MFRISGSGLAKQPISSAGKIPFERIASGRKVNIRVNNIDLTPVLLLVVLGLPLGAGAAMVFFVIREMRRERELRTTQAARSLVDCPVASACPAHRPGCWLAVRSRDPRAVQVALGLHHAKPCSWREGLSGAETLFIAPPVKGWILVTGSGLPDPGEDVDACFRFVVEASRKLGHVQLFSANRFAHHHAWVQANNGRVIRAYAWAGTTLWHQGRPTTAEKELGLKCFDYAEPASRTSFARPEAAVLNVEKVPLLAERWSFDPAQIDERLLAQNRGVAGDFSRRK